MELSPIRQDPKDARIPCRVLKDCGLNGEVHFEGHIGLVSEEFYEHHKKNLQRLARNEHK